MSSLKILLTHPSQALKLAVDSQAIRRESPRSQPFGIQILGACGSTFSKKIEVVTSIFFWAQINLVLEPNYIADYTTIFSIFDTH